MHNGSLTSRRSLAKPSTCNLQRSTFDVQPATTSAPSWLPRRRFHVCLAVVFFAGLLSACGQVNVLTYHNDFARTGQNTNETVLTPANVKTNTFGLLLAYPVDGQIYAQPLCVTGLAIPGKGTHNVVFAATMHNSVYALDADGTGGTNGGVLWHVNLGTSAAMPNNDFGNRYGAYHDIRPEVGIVGTPVIDLSAGTLFVDALTHEGSSYVHRVHALNILTGAEQAHSPVAVTASIPGTGVGSAGGVLAFDPMNNGLQRAALTLAGGILYVTYSGFADTNPYHGWILGFDARTLQQLTNYIFNTTPNSSTTVFGANAGEGGLWMGGNGPTVDANTNLYFMVGNGVFNANSGGSEYADSFIRLSTDGGLTVADYFTPHDQASLAASDTDLGSGGPVLLPDEAGNTTHPHLILGAGKSGSIYLIDREAMGRFNSLNDTQIVQTVSGAIGGVFSTPAYFNHLLYYQPVSDHLKVLSINNAKLSTSALSQSPGIIGFPGATPSVSANGTNNAIAWVLDNGAVNSGTPSGPTVLHAFNAYNLAQELYNSSQMGSRDRASFAVKTSVPTIANGKVYVGGASALSVYGLFNFSNTFITIIGQPTNAVGVQAATSAFAVAASAGYSGGNTSGPAPTISYQWQSAPAGSGTFTNIPGASGNPYTTPLLKLTDNGAQFRVVLTTTSSAATSTVATLSVVRNTIPPVPVQVVSINPAGTGVIVAFSEPLDPAFAQTATNYSFTGNLIPSNAKLDVTGTNLTLTTASALPQNTPITLSIVNVSSLSGNLVPPGASITFSFSASAAGGYASTVLADNPVGYWRLNEASGPTALDVTGAHSGTYGSAATPGVPGPRPPLFPGFEQTNAAVRTFISTPSSFVSVPFGSLSTNAATFTAWVYPIGVQESWAGLLMSRGNGVSGGMGYNDQQMLAYTWNNNSSATYSFVSGLVIPTNQWSLAGMVIYPDQAILYLGNSNVLRSATNTLAHTADVFGNNWEIGHDDNSLGNDGSRTFNGMIDEVAVCNQSLPPARIAAEFQAGLQSGAQLTNIDSSPKTLQFTSIDPISGQVVLQWLGSGTLQEATNLFGPWTISPYQKNPVIAPISDYRFYRLHQ